MARAAPDNERGREPLAGLVERVTFHSAETGFCVLRVKVRGHKDLVTVLGSAAEVHAGESIQASGQWQQHREHGLQFRAGYLGEWEVTAEVVQTLAPGKKEYSGPLLVP